MEKRTLTSVKIDKETFQQLHQAKPEGMSIAYFLRRMIRENNEKTEKVRKLESELEQSRQNFTLLALQKQEGVKL